MHTTTVHVKQQTWTQEKGTHYEESVWYCHHNGDYSGDVTCVKDSDGQPDQVVPFAIMEELVGQKYASDLIGRLEQMSGAAVIAWLAGA